MPHKVMSSASVVGGQSLRNHPLSHRVGGKRNVTVIERLREQIRCIERRTPGLDPAKPAPVPALGRDAMAADGLSDDIDPQVQGVCDTMLFCKPVSNQAGVPATRFANEDGGACYPHITPAPPSSSPDVLDDPGPLGSTGSPGASGPAGSPGILVGQAAALWKQTSLHNKDGSQAVWTLGAVPETEAVARPGMACAGSSRESMARLALDVAGVHEIKPAGLVDSYSDNGSPGDWASAWAAARSLALAMIARRRQIIRGPVLWCMSRRAGTEHGRLYSHGLGQFGLTPADVLLVETGNPQETLWVLEEGLKSQSLALVVGLIDDVALTPARRLALAAQKHHTPCLLLTHPRMPPVAATANTVARRRCAGCTASPQHGAHGGYVACTTSAL